MFVVFEGIDGSGKTTVSGRVARSLRKRGIAVEHFREGGEFASSLVNRLREFGKDPRNLAMEPLPELLFYLAREAQLADELVRPALGRGALVFADRYLHSFEILATAGRGLSPAAVRPIVEAVAGGLWPDMTILLDVDPHLARARRQVSKLAAHGDGPGGGGSRKGLSGVGTQHRLREGYRAMAQAAPDRWLVLGNHGAPLEVLVEAATEAVAALVGGATAAAAAAAGRARLDGAAAPAAAAAAAKRPRALDDARATLYRMGTDFAEREPAVAAYLVAGVAEPAAYDLLDRLAEHAPEVVAASLAGDGGERAWALRDRLVAKVPIHVARSLDGLEVEGPRADAMRAALADRAPRTVLGTLGRNDGAAAWALRDRLAAHQGDVVASLRWLDGERAWALRDAYLAAHGGDAAMADVALAEPLLASLRGLGGERAWRLRRLAADASPAAVISSLAGLSDDEAWGWRERMAGRAGKLVFRTIEGDPSDRAFALRDRHADLVKEALDSMVGLDGEVAWAIRERVADRWPSTTVKSLGALGLGGRGRALAERLLAAHPDNPSLLKHAARLSLGQVARPTV
jgi:dTMP kinase